MGISNKAIEKYLQKYNIAYEIVDDDTIEEDIADNSVIIKSPGIPLYKDWLINKIEKNIPIITDLEFFYQIKNDSNIISVTGSNGKTTTCNILYQLLKEKNFIMAGNMGIPLFSIIDNVYDGIIIETSSYMLEGTISFHPHIHVITNMQAHHLDHHISSENYFSAKLKPLNNMNNNDYLIYEYENNFIKDYTRDITLNFKTFSLTNTNSSCYLEDEYIIYNKERIINLSDILVMNKVVIKDIMIGIIIAKLYGIENKIISNAIKNFVELEHRYEVVYQDQNIVFINDSKATNPFATINAIENTHVNYQGFYIYLIGGGKDGNEQYNTIKPYIKYLSKIALYGENKQLISNIIESETRNNNISVELHENLKDAFDSITNNLEDKTVILFSPSSSSKDQFTSFEERGKMFKSLVKGYIKNNKFSV